MAKAHCMAVAYDPTTNTVLTSATINVYTPGTVTPISATIFDKNNNVLSNPLTADSSTGLIDFYLSVAQEVDLVISKSSFTTRTYSNVPVFDDASNDLSALLTTTGDIIYASGNNTPARLPIAGTANGILAANGGIPAWSTTVTNPAAGGLAISSGLLTAGGGVTLTSGVLTLSGVAAAAGQIRISNNGVIGFRNAANSGDDSINFDASDRLALVCTSNSASATTGANGAPPAQVADYLVLTVNGGARKIAMYNT